MRTIISYLWYIIKHKWYVYQAGWEWCVPLRQRIIHDWSKFLPSEFWPYHEYFYVRGGKEKHQKSGMYQAGKDAAFDAAWLHHIHLNPHHWQHWLLMQDNGVMKALEMPLEFVFEMFADWIGAGKAQKSKYTVQQWYAMNRHKMILHQNTQLLVDQCLEYEKTKEAQDILEKALTQ